MQSTFPNNINDIELYLSWRAEKLASRPVNAQTLMVEIADPYQLSEIEIQAIHRNCDISNMCFYRLAVTSNRDKDAIRAMGKQLGLYTLDGNLCADNDSITSLQTRADGRQQGYIPYTPSQLNWHTDGYYNTAEQMIRGIIMHCVTPAAEGGENQFLDPDLLYIHLRDLNPAYIAALMQTDAMTIPANVEQGAQIRDSQSGPVFSLDNTQQRLHMRYTSRTKSIEWKNDPVITQALVAIREFLQSESDWIIQYRLQAGEGIICNNVLHNRSAYRDDNLTGQTRLLYRARYYERVAS